MLTQVRVGGEATPRRSPLTKSNWERPRLVVTMQVFRIFGTLSGYGSSQGNRGDSHPHRYRLGYAMRKSLKLLTVGLVLVTASAAGCSSTTSGPAGAIQDDIASAPAESASSAASTGPAPSPDPVTPTGGPTEAPASSVASPTNSPSASVSPAGPASLGKAPPVPANNGVCDGGLAYTCGGTGPGTGTVFYASKTPFPCGAGMASSCNYLEVAQNGWNGQLYSCISRCGGATDMTSDWGPNFKGNTNKDGNGYYSCSYKKNSGPNNEGVVIGSGFANTSAMISACNPGGDPGSAPAAVHARGYTGGGQTTWSLPSKDELNALFFYGNRNAIGGFASNYYWSSSQNPSEKYEYEWYQNFSDGRQYSNGNDQFGARPVNAF